MTQTSAGPNPGILDGWVDAEVLAEFPALALRWTRARGAPRKTPPDVREYLRHLSDVVGSPEAIIIRQRPVATAYRVFARQIGLDPDVDTGPLDEAIGERLLRGEFPPNGLPSDACRIATIETGVPIWAMDGDTLEGSPGVRVARAGELIGRGETPLADDCLVTGDARGVLTVLMGTPVKALTPSPRTETVVLFSIVVEGVEADVVDRALSIAANLCTTPPRSPD